MEELEWVVALGGELQIQVVYLVDGSQLDLVEYRVEVSPSLCGSPTSRKRLKRVEEWVLWVGSMKRVLLGSDKVLYMGETVLGSL